jgi:hypothetical protein
MFRGYSINPGTGEDRYRRHLMLHAVCARTRPSRRVRHEQTSVLTQEDASLPKLCPPLRPVTCCEDVIRPCATSRIPRVVGFVQAFPVVRRMKTSLGPTRGDVRVDTYSTPASKPMSPLPRLVLMASELGAASKCRCNLHVADRGRSFTRVEA